MPDNLRTKTRKGMFNISQVIFWSAISAAFIGPGTVTTALKAGANFQLDLLWAVIFSIISCMVLQEAASRITIASGLTLGEAIQQKYSGTKRINLKDIISAGVIFGCIAYQAGNLTGASEAVQLFSILSKEWILFIIAITSALLMWKGNIRHITNTLGLLVAIMAILFAFLAFQSGITVHQVFMSSFRPKIPINSSVLVIGLIGTTIVPYNLFLGSGLSRGKDLKSTRNGLIPAIAIGGLITICILFTGTLLDINFDFKAISETFKIHLGDFGTYAFAIGLFAAGFTSGITAPFAAAITAQSAVMKKHDPGKLSFRMTWAIVLCVGLFFSLTNYHPVTLILIAQALNGLILPFVAVSVYLVLNDKNIVPERYANGKVYNLITLAVVGFTIFLGLNYLMNVILPLIDIKESNSIGYTFSAMLSIISVGLLAFISHDRGKIS